MSQGVRGSPRSPVFIGLAAIAMAVPLAVLAGAAGPYDDPKAWSLPLLVAATVVVGLVRSRTLPGREGPADDGPGRVLCWTIAASLGWWFITTAVSIAPGQSLLGVFGRGMGLITIGAAALVFFVVRIECRSARAMWGLIDAALLGSVPVCVLALGQAAGWDPLPGSWDPAVVDLGVRSTLGQHTFLGSYLVVLVPLAAGRLDSALRACRAAESVAGARGVPVAALVTGAVWTAGALGLVELASGWDPGWWLLVPWGIAGAAVWALVGAAARERPGSPIAVALLALLLLMQVAVVVLSRARGALLATLLGLVVAGVAMLAGRRARKMLALSAATAGLVVLGIGLLNVPDSPLAPLARIGVLSRLSHVTDVGRGTPGWFRLRVWKGIASGWRRQLAGEEVVPDTRPVLRSVIGYGPETQLLVLEPFSRPSLGVRRAGGSGWRGQYLVDRAHNALLDQLVTGGLVGAGLWLTLVGSLIAVGVSRVRRASPGEEWSIRWACLAAVMAHIAEGQVGVETVAPLVLFWMAAGLLSTPPWSPPPTPRPDSPSSRRSAWLLAVVAVSLAAVLIAWLGTRWLLASMWYADGVRLQ
ncbi:MAG TPA: hypothetical protein VEL75_21495, partial [Candidatus Methylomirabilis sp.]|nr:hypothetical protein [Candidatus Methylomirabilis sp.]